MENKKVSGMAFRIFIKGQRDAGIPGRHIVVNFDDHFIWDKEMKDDMTASLAEFYDTPGATIEEIEPHTPPPSPAIGGKEEGYCEDHDRPYVGECPDCLREDGPEFAPAGAEEYVPFGEEWATQMSKCPKKLIVEMFGRQGVELSAAQAKIAELQARVNELQEWHDSHL